jgi:hypothetical protein
MKNAVFCDVTTYDFCNNRRFGKTHRPHHFLFSVLRLLVIANFPSCLILFTLRMETIGSSETPAVTNVTRRHIPEEGNLHSHRRENLKSYALPYSLHNILVSCAPDEE